ncbi:hypothetical protein EXIGLDRAFT_779681 [Exidia glandulosa HHB12029]|uniref:Uncharacterized protein n=1 Tax=Exidia glandulosa HHB12029 TaxID=1314781 RepID=A0A165BY68_EXIGL|nr:hypothetical protein EXIGLDRAFT_779681 [Exidia glandulosa HHB12029]
MHFLAALCVLVCTAVKAQSVVTLDLADPAITRSSNWGSNPARTERNGAWWAYNFVGTSLDIKLYASQGYGLVNITLDGKSTTVDTSSPDSHVTSMDAMSVNDLAPTSHTLRLALIGPSPNGGTAPSGQVWLRINSISAGDSITRYDVGAAVYEPIVHVFIITFVFVTFVNAKLSDFEQYISNPVQFIFKFLT